MLIASPLSSERLSVRVSVSSFRGALPLGAYPGVAISRIRTETTTSSTNAETGSSKDRAGSCANGGGAPSSRERQAARGPAGVSQSGGPNCGSGTAEGMSHNRAVFSMIESRDRGRQWTPLPRN